MDSEELIEKVQSYFFLDEKLAKKFEEFVGKNCIVIDLNSNENKLVYTEIYNQYKIMFEESLESYIESIGSTIYEFYQAIRKRTDEDENSSDAVFGQILASVIEYDIFMVMMREAAQLQQLDKSSNHK